MREFGLESERVSVLPNVIDLARFDQQAQETCDLELNGAPTAVTICRMIPAKRLERFLHALQLANEKTTVNGLFIGDGPQRVEGVLEVERLPCLPVWDTSRIDSNEAASA